MYIGKPTMDEQGCLTVQDPIHRDSRIAGRSGLTMGRQIGAYPILIGVNYQIPESMSDIIVWSHGARSITGIETNLDPNIMTERQFGHPWNR